MRGFFLALFLLIPSAASAQGGFLRPHNGLVLPGVYITRMIPPPQYKAWYQSMERCVGAKGDYKKVEWLVVAVPWVTGQRKTHGSWSGTADNSGQARITVNAEEWEDSTLIQHEAIHDILWRNGWRAPPLPVWATDTDTIYAKHPAPPYGKCAPTFYNEKAGS